MPARGAGAAGHGLCGEPAYTAHWHRVWRGQGDVRSSPMAYPAVRSLPKLPLPLRPETGPTS
eukprot:scaffold6576_cov65-Phaeocystis_antarctica.AAC.3